MLVVEPCVLRAVRARLRTELTLQDEQCEVELEDTLPGLAERTYYAITHAGTVPGPTHRSSGTVWDLLISVRVAIYERITHTARDKRRDISIDLTTGLAKKMSDVIKQLDFNYTLTDEAATILTATGDTAATNFKIPEPFRGFSLDQAPQKVMFEPYDAGGKIPQSSDPIIALKRGCTFHNMRYLKVR